MNQDQVVFVDINCCLEICLKFDNLVTHQSGLKRLKNHQIGQRYNNEEPTFWLDNSNSILHPSLHDVYFRKKSFIIQLSILAPICYKSMILI